MTTRDRRDDLTSSKTATRENKASMETNMLLRMRSAHIIKPDKHEGYLAYKIRSHPSMIPLEASVIS